MSTRWMMVQYVGNMLRLPVVNESDMDKPFGSSVLEHDVQRIVVNPFSENPRTFVPESENAKLRELVRDAHALATDHGVYVRYPYCDAWDEKLAVVEEQMRELGIEVDK